MIIAYHQRKSQEQQKQKEFNMAYQFIDTDLEDKYQLPPEMQQPEQSSVQQQGELYNPNITPVDKEGITKSNEATTKRMMDYLDFLKPKSDVQTEERLKKAAMINGVGNFLGALSPMLRKDNRVILKQEDKFTQPALERYQKMIAEDKANEYQNSLMKTKLAVDNIAKTDAEIKGEEDYNRKLQEQVNQLNWKYKQEQGKKMTDYEERKAFELFRHGLTMEQIQEQFKNNMAIHKTDNASSNSRAEKTRQYQEEKANYRSNPNDVVEYYDANKQANRKTTNAIANSVLQNVLKNEKDEYGDPLFNENDMGGWWNSKGELTEAGKGILYQYIDKYAPQGKQSGWKTWKKK